MNATFWRFVAATLLALPSLRIAVADGPQDNLIENVRRIPALGVEVPADRAASLRNGLTQLQEKIAAVRASNDPAKIALLPDVMIFERAVRVALDHQ